MKLKRKKRNYGITIISIVLVTCFLLNVFGNSFTHNVKDIVQSSMRSKIYSYIYDIFDRDSIMNEKMIDIIMIQKNQDGEIISVDYRFHDAYRYLNSSMERLKTNIQNIDMSDTMIKGKNDVFFVPSTMVSHNVLMNELGFKIPVRVRMLKNIDMSFKTKVTNYGINSLLVELYLNVSIMNEILVVGDNSYQEENFEIVIAAKLIQGKIPNYYGGYLEKSSSIVSS